MAQHGKGLNMETDMVSRQMLLPWKYPPLGKIWAHRSNSRAFKGSPQPRVKSQALDFGFEAHLNHSTLTLCDFSWTTASKPIPSKDINLAGSTVWSSKTNDQDSDQNALSSKEEQVKFCVLLVVHQV